MIAYVLDSWAIASMLQPFSFGEETVPEVTSQESLLENAWRGLVPIMFSEALVK